MFAQLLFFAQPFFLALKTKHVTFKQQQKKKPAEVLGAPEPTREDGKYTRNRSLHQADSVAARRVVLSRWNSCSIFSSQDRWPQGTQSGLSRPEAAHWQKCC